jgi:hypothetical protein
MPPKDRRRMKSPIVVYGGPGEWYRRPMVSEDEVLAGPKFENETEAGRVRAVRLQPGAFDMARLAESLGPGRAPDGCVVQVNRSGQTVARSLHALAGPKVLAVGDTHHMPNPLSYMLTYAQGEPFDAVMLEFNRQHAHWFVEAGYENVRWLPLFSVNPRPRDVVQRITLGVAMIGALGDHHPQRRRIVEALRAAGLPVAAATLNQDAAADAYATTAVSLNVSLNGDLNLRIVEALSAGACLLTDRLAPQAGLDLLFEADRDLIVFDDADAAVDAARALLGDPGHTLSIRRAGRARALAEHGPGDKIAALHAILDGRDHDDRFALRHEPRCLRPVIGLDAVLRRVRVYEAVQEAHRVQPRLRAAIGPGVDPLIAGDLADLPRLDIVLLADAARDAVQDEHLRADGVADRIAVARDWTAAVEAPCPVVAILSDDGLSDEAMDRLTGADAVALIVIPGLNVGAGARVAAVTAALARRGFQSVDPLAAAFARAASP